MEHLKLDKPIEIKLKRGTHIDVCDVVHHVPSGENWVVACVDGDRLYWVGYPFGGSAALSDCQLVTKASSEDRQKLLVQLCVHPTLGTRRNNWALSTLWAFLARGGYIIPPAPAQVTRAVRRFVQKEGNNVRQ